MGVCVRVCVRACVCVCVLFFVLLLFCCCGSLSTFSPATNCRVPRNMHGLLFVLRRLVSRPGITCTVWADAAGGGAGVAVGGSW